MSSVNDLRGLLHVAALSLVNSSGTKTKIWDFCRIDYELASRQVYFSCDLVLFSAYKQAEPGSAVDARAHEILETSTFYNSQWYEVVML